MKRERLGLWFAIVTILLWGPWGAWIDLPASAGFPETMGYVVWSLTMIIPAGVALFLNHWKLEWHPQALFYGFAPGLLGAGADVLLFLEYSMSPASLVVPLHSTL